LSSISPPAETTPVDQTISDATPLLSPPPATTEKIQNEVLWSFYSREDVESTFYFNKRGTRYQDVRILCKYPYCGQTFYTSKLQRGQSNMKTHLEVHGIYSDSFSLGDEKEIALSLTQTKSQNLALMRSKKLSPKSQSKTDISGQLKQQKDKSTALQVENEYMKMFLSGNLPFVLSENPHLRKMLTLLKAPKSLLQKHRGTIASGFNGWEEEVKQQLMKDLILADAICISIDAWTSTAQSQYLSVLCHYSSSEFEYRECILKFLPVNSDHRWSSLGKQIFQILKDFNIHHKLLAVSADSASNNGTLASELQRLIRNSYISLPDPASKSVERTQLSRIGSLLMLTQCCKNVCVMH
jgi:hypothetical protein